MRKLAKASIGATVFFASSHPSESCGSNGLPLTPNSIKIVGRFQVLKAINHPNLCKYITIARGKQERVILVAEHHPQCLSDELLKGIPLSSEKLVRLAYDVCQGLSHLNILGMVHRCLSPANILLDNLNLAKLSRYGLYHITDCGTCVSFPIGIPSYMAPEVLACGPLNEDHGICQPVNPSSPNVDTWSLGIILLEVALGTVLFNGLPIKEIFAKILSLIKEDINQSAVHELIRGTQLEDKYKALPEDVRTLIETCLIISPVLRLQPKDLLFIPVFTSKKFHLDTTTLKLLCPCFPSIDLRSKSLNLPGCTDNLDEDHLGERALDEVFYLWELAGGDLDVEMRRQGMIKTKPPVCCLPKTIIEEGEMFGQKKDRAFLLDENVVELSLLQLRQRLSKIPPEAFYPLTENFESKTYPSSINNMSDLTETARLPLIIREKDIEYQFHRIVLYQRLLMGYPYKRPHIWKEARVDIPPLYRGHVWAVLLDIEGDISAHYDAIDKETATLTDRQIEVDIPRCHQYDELLSSPTGHMKFKRLLKAWVISHPQYVYWQGQDSLCAPFIYLNFNDEALAYACFSAFIDKYLYCFFLKDNSDIIKEYLAVFSHLIGFHDPDLSNHLNSIGFIPELYAIPWFLTMYTHVFPLHKIFHLWDTLLLGNASFPLFVGVAILQQLRDGLLSFGFNECILLFSDMPEIDIERCVRDSIDMFCKTPGSATYRQHEKRKVVKSNSHERGLSIISANDSNNHYNELTMDPISLEVLKAELSPRISAEDLLELLDKDQANFRAKLNRAKPKVFVVDIRPAEEFVKGAIAESINIPFHTAFLPEGTLNPCLEVTALNSHRGRIIVVVGKENGHANNFAEQLIQLGFPRVCTLHKGISILRHTNYLVVPAAEVRTPT